MPVTDESCATIISTSGRIQGLTYAGKHPLTSTGHSIAALSI
jgi:hypothetical protein